MFLSLDAFADALKSEDRRSHIERASTTTLHHPYAMISNADTPGTFDAPLTIR